MSNTAQNTAVDKKDDKQEDQKVGLSNGGEGRKAPTQSGRPKLRWSAIVEGQDPRTAAVTAKLGEGEDQIVFRITESKEGWQLTVRKGGKTETVIKDVSRQRAYTAATDLHHRDAKPQPKKAAAKSESSAA